MRTDETWPAMLRRDKQRLHEIAQELREIAGHYLDSSGPSFYAREAVVHVIDAADHIRAQA